MQDPGPGLHAPDAAFGLSFAFQPILDTRADRILSYEALVRGPQNQDALWALSRGMRGDLYKFDEHCRLQAIRLAARLGLQTRLNLNFLPLALQRVDIRLETMLGEAAACGLQNRLVLEVTESELIDDPAHFAAALNQYRRDGLRLAIDDFGAGYSGLNLLAEFQPDYVKIDMSLVRSIERHGPRQAIIRAIVQVCLDLGIEPLAEGVETREEFDWLRAQGIALFQGFLFAPPGFERLPECRTPGRDF